MTTIAVVSAGLSEPSSTRMLADRLADAAVASLGETTLPGGPARVRHVDLRPLAHEITDAMLTRFAPPALAAAIEVVTGADAVVFVTPVFTAGMSGLAKSFLDVLEPDALTDMPVLVAATGGTARHSLAIEHGVRPVFAYLRAAVVPTGVFAATDDWGSADGAAALDARILRAGADLAWAIRASRRSAPVAEADRGADAATSSELPAVTDFGAVLARLAR